ncbi:MAG: DNA mismatch repair protein MutS [Oligoflexia bacterium]|nr:DNA mismatch repair protein MutS [Oligoflexia bacterium]
MHSNTVQDHDPGFQSTPITPMLRQYHENKAKVPGKLLFFRMGDFYELFSDDALVAAPILGIALTSRDKKNPIPMCGIPFHAVSSYISKLTRKGYSVAICEQVEDPKKAKGIVKRDIIRVVTPSLVYDSDSIEGKQASFLASISPDGKKWSYAYLDYSTGEFFAGSCDSTDDLVKELSLINPREIIFDNRVEIPEVLKKLLLSVSFFALDVKSLSHINMNNIIIDSRLGKSEVGSARLVMQYLVDTQYRTDFPHIRYLARTSTSEHLGLDEFTSRNLDLFGSFLQTLDATVSPMGGRILRQSISQPLNNKAEIEKRLDSVDIFKSTPDLLEDIRSRLFHCGDMDRLLSKIAVSQYSPRGLRKLLESIEIAADIAGLIESRDLPLDRVGDTGELMSFTQDLLDKLETEQPATIYDGSIFKKGFNSGLDSLIDLHYGSRKILMEMEAREKERTRISSLKIKYNRVFGYYIEITRANLHLVPADYQRKQTLVNGERFVTEELKELEVRLLTADEKRKELELKLVEEYAEQIRGRYISKIGEISEWLAKIDLLCGFAWIASKRNYVKPSMNDGFDLDLKDARHPVIWVTMGDEFVPNDISFTGDDFFQIITGPNMAGKSTLMRTLALTVIMAHIGSYVPAAYANIPLVDKVFTRVGATDYILQGQSTFMVEMIEASNIIHSATERSLIILDEIGRGTSTYDGISIAWALAEYIHNRIGAKCMFATHYHELTALDAELKGAVNLSMAVEEESEGLFFLRKVVRKPASRSYGIQVAAMAGLPSSIIKRAFSVMNGLENERRQASLVKEDINQLSLFSQADFNADIAAKQEYKFIEELSSIDLDKLTPLEALSRLYKWKEEVNEEQL